MRVVGSLTTIPGRYPRLLRTLKSLVAQDWPLDAIYVGIPAESRRLKQPYPPLPDEILSRCIQVPCAEDYGPITKIVGGLLMESDPDTVIITFDDDVVYSRTMVGELVRLHLRHPRAAIGSSGALLRYNFPFYSSCSNVPWGLHGLSFDIGPDGRNVDSLFGFSGVLYVRHFFPRAENLYEQFLKYPMIDTNVYHNDDIMISAYLSKQSIERKIFPNLPVVGSEAHLYESVDGDNHNALSNNKIDFMTRFGGAIAKTKEWGFFPVTEPVAPDETVGGVIIIVAILIALLLLVSYLWFVLI